MNRPIKAHKCPVCGTAFYKQGGAKFCAIDCHIEHYTDRTPGHGPDGDCHLWTLPSYNNNPRISTDKHGKKRTFAVRRILYAKSHGVSEQSFTKQVVHITCGTKNCVNPAHMVLGPVVKGEPVVAANPQKLDWDKVAQIRALAGKMTTAQIGNMFGVTASTVQQIFKNKIWRKELMPTPDSIVDNSASDTCAGP